MKPPSGYVGPLINDILETESVAEKPSVAGKKHARSTSSSSSSSPPFDEGPAQLRPREKKRELKAVSASTPAQLFVETSARLRNATPEMLLKLLQVFMNAFFVSFIHITYLAVVTKKYVCSPRFDEWGGFVGGGI